jgi:hypothetical protein
MLSPRLAWVLELQNSVNRATGGQFKSFVVVSNADPLRAFIKFDLHEDLAPNDFHPFRALSQGFAVANDCILERLHRGESSITLEVLLKRRLGPPMKRNPILSGKA